MSYLFLIDRRRKLFGQPFFPFRIFARLRSFLPMAAQYDVVMRDVACYVTCTSEATYFAYNV